MGSSFTNVQVHRGELAADAARARIIEQIRETMAGRGMIPADGAGTAVRRILIAPPSQGGWISVYDSAIESQDDREITGFTGLLSRACSSAAVGVRVHDGDLLDLWLFEAGAERDHGCNWPGYFEGKPPPEEASGKLAAWGSLLVEGATPDALRAAWETAPRPDGTAILARMAPLLGWDPGAVTVGLRSLPDALRARCTELSFAPAAKPAEPLRPPVLGHAGGAPDSVRARVGESISIVAVAHNTGGPLHGLSVVLFGPVIEKELIRAEPLTVVLGDPRRGARLCVPVSAVTTTGQRTWTAELRDVELPAGFADMAAAYRAAASADQAISAWTAARIEVHLDAVVVERGRGELHIGFVPAENPEGGQTSWSVEVRAGAR